MTPSYEGRHVLVTGASGFVASTLVRVLARDACRLTLVSRDASRLGALAGAAHVRTVSGDVSQRAVWEETLPGIDVVFHLAAQTSVYVAAADAVADLGSNVLPIVHLLETCRLRRWNPAVIVAGTVTEAGMPERLPVDESHPDRPITVYDLHKWMAEGYLKSYADQGLVRGASLRLANVYGPGPRSSSADRGILNVMIRRALAGEPITIYGRGEHLRDYVYVDDVVRAFLVAGLAIDAVNGRHFVIGSGEGTTIADALTLVADRVALVRGRRVPVTHVEPPASLSSIEARDFVADTGAFRKATGWQPRWSLADGIDRTIAAFLERVSS